LREAAARPPRPPLVPRGPAGPFFVLQAAITSALILLSAATLVPAFGVADGISYLPTCVMGVLIPGFYGSAAVRRAGGGGGRRGRSNTEIAADLFRAGKTVKTHISSILATLPLVDRTQAAVCAVKHGIE
jgi:hypothetical protein